MDLDIADFIESVNKYKEEMIISLTENMESTCDGILSEAKEVTPMDIGILKENSGYSVKYENSELIGTIGFMEFYAVYVHQGTGLFALNGDGRQTPWWWKGTTEKWEGWHKTVGQKPKQFLFDTLVKNINSIPEKLGGS